MPRRSPSVPKSDLILLLTRRILPPTPDTRAEDRLVDHVEVKNAFVTGNKRSYQDPVGAVSPRAALLLAAQMSARLPVMVQPPSWAEHVRPLGWDEALQVQRVADAAITGNPLPETPLLSEWERAEASARPVRNPVNAAMMQARSYEFEDYRRFLRPVTTPASLVLQPMSVHSERWNTAAVARYLGVESSTVRSWRSRRQMGFPAPDSDDGASAWWFRSTIEVWHAGRPGRGNHGPRSSRG